MATTTSTTRFTAHAAMAALGALLISCSEPAATPAPTTLTLNDVSVLYPLPTSLNESKLLAPNDAGARGVLLPRDVYDAISEFPVMPPEGLAFDDMRVVAARFDGCGGPPGACLSELRLVMQPINDDGSTRDSALHLFYRLEGTEMSVVVSELRRLRTLAPEVTKGPLDVHPALVAQGMTGAYASALRELILAHAGADNLVRMTFFLRAPPLQDVWFFGGFERALGSLTQMDIAGVGMSNQRVIFTTDDSGHSYELTPNPTTPEDGSALLSTSAALSASDEVRRATFASYVRLANPKRYVPDQLSCAGCHVASFVTSDARQRFGLDAASFPDDAFSSTHDLSQRGAAATTPNSLRALGYFGTAPMIAQRVINDSAAVVDDLEARYPAATTAGQ